MAPSPLAAAEDVEGAPAAVGVVPFAAAAPSEGARTSKARAATGWAVGVAALVYLAHALAFGSWLIDDAGISFAYARNLAAGHGLVSQPGLPPVEGYSNTLWVLILALPYRLGAFHTTLTPKLLSLALVVGSYALLGRGLRLLTGSVRLVIGVLLLLSVNSAFAIWTCSGLENPLYVFLLCALFHRVVAERRGDAEPGAWSPIGAGLLATALALTRPDAILCAVLYPLLTVVPRRDGRIAWRAAGRRIGLYAAAFAASYGAFLAFRLLYFGQLLPNTYYAKGGLAHHGVFNTFTLQLMGIVKLVKLLGAVAGAGAGMLLLALIAGTAFGLARRRLRFVHGATLAFAAVPAVAYMLLPVDWMPGFRFATPVFPFLYAYILALAGTLGEAVVPARWRRLAADLAIVAALGASIAIFLQPSFLFAANPTVPFSEVVRDYGLAFNRYAEMLDVRQGSILAPDLGGTLYTSRLRVYDLAGLCDRTIGGTLRRDQAAFYDYVFDEIKPTFIHTHEYWTAAARFELDPRFRRDYAPLVEYVEDWVRQKTGRELHSGNFVRRADALRRPRELSRIRQELAARYWREIQESAPPPPPARFDEWAPPPEAATMQPRAPGRAGGGTPDGAGGGPPGDR